MRVLPQNLIIEKNRLASAGSWIILIEITLTDGDSTVLRIARNTEDVTAEDWAFQLIDRAAEKGKRLIFVTINKGQYYQYYKYAVEKQINQ